ncbi:uncharacterized protein VTP21DRAFT_2082 [Calcarisporiella thermophila]|uniref:uncharacterized protein n=1 Tax=Calcarisporiella thermophila TaxID=911321 RepID=UPI0037428FFA
MPIRHFDIFIAERRLVQTSSINQLRDTRVGIEGSHWLRRLLQTTVKEPAVVAMGGIPLGLRAAIERELDLFASHGIQPFFVFNGLNITRKDKPFSTEDHRPSKRATGWEHYERGKTDQAMSAWLTSGSIHQPDLLNSVFKVLYDRGIEFMRAPYSSWGQLVYLHNHPKNYVHALYGGSELLMYDVDKIIISFDLEKGNYNWISKKSILNDLQVSDDQFLDICILAGFEWCSTFPILTTDIGFSFKGTHDLIKQHKTGFNAVQFYSDNPAVHKSNYVDTFCRTRCALKYHVVYGEDGKVEPLNVENAPSDIHEFIGYRLPDDIYYYISKSLIGTQVINTLVSGMLVESPPLCNGDTTEYRNFVNDLQEVRAQSLDLLTQPLHQFYQSKRVVSLQWYEPTNEHPMVHHKSAGEGLKWQVSGEVVREEMKRLDVSSGVDLAFCLNATAKKDRPLKTSKLEGAKPLENKDEILANALWRGLRLRGYLTPENTHTVWGQALAKALATEKGEKRLPPIAQEQLLLAFELIKHGVLKADHYSRTYHGAPSIGTDAEKKHVLLITRTLSLLPMQFHNSPWTGPLNRELLCFNSFVKAGARTLRNLFEMLILSMFLHGECKRAQDDYFNIYENTPYLQDVNDALGIVSKTYLDRVLSSEMTKEEAAKNVEEVFTACKNVRGDLKSGFQFWDKVVAGVKVLVEGGAISKELGGQFEEADRWLGSRRL